MGNVLLLGLSHADPFKEQLLERAFAQENPDCISVESTPESSEALQRDRREYLEALEYDKDTIPPESYKLARYVYEKVSCAEVLTSKRYGEAHRIPVELTDHPRMPLIAFPALPHQLNEVPSAQGAIAAMAQQTCALYQFLLSQLKDPASATSRQEALRHYRPVLRTQGEKRDAYPAQRILALQKMYTKVLHVCGAIHTLDDEQEETLYSLLVAAGLKPERRLLIEYAAS